MRTGQPTTAGFLYSDTGGDGPVVVLLRKLQKVRDSGRDCTADLSVCLLRDALAVIIPPCKPITSISSNS